MIKHSRIIDDVGVRSYILDIGEDGSRVVQVDIKSTKVLFVWYCETRSSSSTLFMSNGEKWALVSFIYHKDKLKEVQYRKLKYGVNHSITGPAVVNKARKCKVEYYLFGAAVSKEDWESHPLVIAALVNKLLDKP